MTNPFDKMRKAVDKPEKCNWQVEYEIPPLRAIYYAAADNCTELEALMMIAKEQPRWRVRKLTKVEEPQARSPLPPTDL